MAKAVGKSITHLSYPLDEGDRVPMIADEAMGNVMSYHAVFDDTAKFIIFDELHRFVGMSERRMLLEYEALALKLSDPFTVRKLTDQGGTKMLEAHLNNDKAVFGHDSIFGIVALKEAYHTELTFRLSLYKACAALVRVVHRNAETNKERIAAGRRIVVRKDVWPFPKYMPPAERNRRVRKRKSITVSEDWKIALNFDPSPENSSDTVLDLFGGILEVLAPDEVHDF